MAKADQVERKTPELHASLLRLGLRKLRRHKVAIAGAWVLGTLYLCALFADFIAPYHYDNEVRTLSYHPPSRIHIFDKQGKPHRPFIYIQSFEFDEYYRRVYTEDTSRGYPIKFFVRGDRHKVLWLFETELHLFGTDPGARIYLLGADHRGRDLFTRILFGSRISLSIGLVGVTITFVLGMLFGGISGYLGGKADFIMMRICEMIMMIPSFYLLLALRSSFPPKLRSVHVYILIVLILSFIGWAGFARVVRGMVLSIREREFVLAARAGGTGSLSIICKHILPNTLSYAIISLTLSVPGYILGESALSFLGLGIQDPDASWGNLLSEAMSIATLKFHPWILIPGIFIFLAVMAFNFLGDGLRDAFDPRSLAALGRR